MGSIPDGTKVTYERFNELMGQLEGIAKSLLTTIVEEEGKAEVEDIVKTLQDGIRADLKEMVEDSEESKAKEMQLENARNTLRETQAEVKMLEAKLRDARRQVPTEIQPQISATFERMIDELKTPVAVKEDDSKASATTSENGPTPVEFDVVAMKFLEAVESVSQLNGSLPTVVSDMGTTKQVLEKHVQEQTQS